MLGVNFVLLLPGGNRSFLSVGDSDARSKQCCVILPEGNINILSVGNTVYEALLVDTI